VADVFDPPLFSTTSLFVSMCTELLRLVGVVAGGGGIATS
jgi:hypothetical protein